MSAQGTNQGTPQSQRFSSAQGSPGDLLVAPLRSIGTAVLQGFQHQKVTLPVAEQQVSISPTRSIQKTFHSLVKGADQMGKASTDEPSAAPPPNGLTFCSRPRAAIPSLEFLASTTASTRLRRAWLSGLMARPGVTA